MSCEQIYSPFQKLISFVHFSHALQAIGARLHRMTSD